MATKEAVQREYATQIVDVEKAKRQDGSLILDRDGMPQWMVLTAVRAGNKWPDRFPIYQPLKEELNLQPGQQVVLVLNREGLRREGGGKSPFDYYERVVGVRIAQPVSIFDDPETPGAALPDSGHVAQGAAQKVQAASNPAGVAPLPWRGSEAPAEDWDRYIGWADLVERAMKMVDTRIHWVMDGSEGGDAADSMYKTLFKDSLGIICDSIREQKQRK